MLFGLLKGVVKSAVMMAALAVAGGGYLYYKVAAGKLAAPEGSVVTSGLCRPTPSLSGGTLPVTFEAYVKDPKQHNFLESGRPIGLVRKRLEWSHARFEWVEDATFVEAQAEAVAVRQKLAQRAPEELIKDLRSDDAVRREVSAKQLLVTTGQTLGYAYDSPREQRDQAAAAWDKWWADDANKLRYKGREWIDAGQKALDLLKRATEAPPPGGGGGTK